MPNVNLKIDVVFTITPSSDAGDVESLCREICDAPCIEVGAFEENPNLTTSFQIFPDKMANGETTFTNNGSSVTVSASGTANVNAKSEYMDLVLSSATHWRLNGLSEVWIGEFACEGLEKIDFMAKRRGKEIEDYYWKLSLTA